jgi:hypothetical protein
MARTWPGARFAFPSHSRRAAAVSPTLLKRRDLRCNHTFFNHRARVQVAVAAVDSLATTLEAGAVAAGLAVADEEATRVAAAALAVGAVADMAEAEAAMVVEAEAEDTVAAAVVVAAVAMAAAGR